MSLPTPSRRLTLLAWWNVAIHASALVAAAVWMKPGSPAVPLDERLAYLTSSALPWSLAWGSWLLCTLSLVAFYAVLANRLPERPAAARFAVTLAAAGAAVDLFCYGLQIAVLPMLAGMGREAVPTFLALERAAGAGGLIAANGMYTVGGLVLTLCLRGRPGLAPFAVGTGYVVFAGGMLLVVAGFSGDVRLAMAATPATIIPYCAWVVLAARSLEREKAE